ncbi:MAG: hypothetical protein ABJG47_04205 [Ekhidna sp.]
MEEKRKKDIASPEKTPQWLKTIQLNSWEAELLISALVLYALFQVPDQLDNIALQNFSRGSNLHGLFRIIERAVQLLSFGYILHILVRGIWVASVGLSYVFPQGVDEKALKFKGNFKKELTKSGSLVKMVLRLEELSSIIYGISFIFFGTLVGFGSLLFSFIFFIELIGPILNSNPFMAPVIGMLILFYALLCLIVFIDFLTNGFFRRKNWSADWFYYVALFFRVVTLSFLYRRSLLVLISNTKGWKSYLIPFIVLGISGGFVYLRSTLRDNSTANYYIGAAYGDYNAANYENTRSKDHQLITTIQSDIVSQNTLKVFLKDLRVFGSAYAFEGKLQKTKWDQLTSDSSSLFFNEKLSVKIDDVEIEGLKWFKSQHSSNYEFGFTTFIDINTFEAGPHFLKIGMDTTGMKNASKKLVEEEKYSLQTISNIYFVYDKP